MISVRAHLHHVSRAPQDDGPIAAFAEGLGWDSSDVRRLQGSVPSATAFQLSAVTEPQAVLIVPRNGADRRELLALGYSTESPFTLISSRESLALFETNVWRDVPGDAPLFDVAPDDPEAEDLADLLRPHALVRRVPALYRVTGTSHEELARVLGDALLQLRLAAAQNAAFAEDDPSRGDLEVLRLFHQFLFIRYSEDWQRHDGVPKLAGVLDEPDVAPHIETILSGYAERADSELFEYDSSNLLAKLPAAALGDVVRALTTPYTALRLNFSVTRTDLAGRLYEEYLGRLPITEQQGRQASLFPLVVHSDERQQSASFYTPYPLASHLAESALGNWLRDEQPSSPDGVRVLDPACGSGAFLLASFRVLLKYFATRYGRPLTHEERAEILTECIHGADLDERAIALAKLQLLEEANLPGTLPRLETNFFHGDALRAPPWIRSSSPGVSPAVSWASVMDRVGGFNVILANPPFGSQLRLPSRLQATERQDLRELYPSVRAWGVDFSYFFLELALGLLSPRGRVGFVLPRTWLDSYGARKSRAGVENRIEEITDFRGLRAFPGVASYVATVVIAESERSAEISVSDVPSSREDALLVLRALGGRERAQSAELGPVLEEARAGALVRRERISRDLLKRCTEDGWTGFRLRWAALQSQVPQAGGPFAPRSGRGQRIVVQGTQPGDLGRFVFEQDEWSDCGDGIMCIKGVEISKAFVPLFVRGRDLGPFRVQRTGLRLFVPFTEGRTLSTDPGVLELLDRIGGLPLHPQPGDLQTLLGPKVLIRAFAREPCAFADTEGRFVTIKGTGGALGVALPGAKPRRLRGLEALLNASFYQWLMEGLGRPRADETVELLVADIAQLPWPEWSDEEWHRVETAGAAVRAALSSEDVDNAIERYLSAREALDDLVLELLDVSEEMRGLIRAELRRVA